MPLEDGATDDDRGVMEAVPVRERLELRLDGEIGSWNPAHLAFDQPLGAGVDEPHLGPSLEDVNLELELPGTPQVVGVEEGDVGGGGLPDPGVPRDRRQAAV